MVLRQGLHNWGWQQTRVNKLYVSDYDEHDDDDGGHSGNGNIMTQAWRLFFFLYFTFPLAFAWFHDVMAFFFFLLWLLCKLIALRL